MADLKDFTLDVSSGKFKEWLDQSTKLILKNHENLPHEKAFQYRAPDKLAGLFETRFPLKPTPVNELLKVVENDILPYCTKNTGPHFYSYVLSPGNQAGLIGELISSYLNMNTGKWHLAAPAVEMEKQVIKWIAEFIGYDTAAAGLLVSGGSIANLVCLNVARDVNAGINVAQEGLSWRRPLTAYISEQAHYCINKAIATLGIGTKHVRKVPTDKKFRMDLKALKVMIQNDQAAGYQPFCLVASAGTVNTGSVDPLNKLASICKANGLWFHVDAAYGGPAAGIDLTKKHFIGLEKADSIALDPHKWFYVPIEAGCILVKNPEFLRQTFSMVPEYLQTGKEEDRTDFMEYGLQLTRSFRALKVWMTFKAYGKKKLINAIEQDILKVKYLEKKLRASKEFEVVAPAILSIVCFRYRPKDLRSKEGELEKLNLKLLDTIEEDGRVFVTGTRIDGKIALRVCIVNHRTQKQHLDILFEVLMELAAKVYAAKGRTK